MKDAAGESLSDVSPECFFLADQHEKGIRQRHLSYGDPFYTADGE